MANTIPFLNPVTSQLEFYNQQDLTPQNLQALAGRGLRQSTPEDVANRERTLEYGSTAQQALAQAERVVRGGTLGLVEGLAGTDEEQRARAEVSQELSPVTSFAADLLPDVALGAVTGGVAGLATGAGRAAAAEAAGLGVRAALGAASKAAPLAALAGESVAGGLVTSAQQAYQEGRSAFRDDPVQDATNALFWAGIGGVLGGAPMAFKAARSGLGKAGKEVAEVADEVDLDSAFRQGEADVGLQPQATPVPESAGSDSFGVPHTTDEGTLEAAAREQVSPRVQEVLDKMRQREAQAGGVTLDNGMTEEEYQAKLAALRSRRAGGAAPGPGTVREIPLDDVRVMAKDGFLEPATPRQLKRHSADIQAVAENAFAGKSLKELRALPLESTESRAKIEAFKADEGFRSTGHLPKEIDNGRGGLPSLVVEADGNVYLSNGRHRLTAAKETGQEYIVANIKKYNKRGDTVWDYVGPVRVNPPPSRVASRAGERGMVDARSLATSPMGNVIAGGAGAALGAQVDGQEGAIAGGALGLIGSALLGRRGARKAMAGSHLGETLLGKGSSNIAQKEAAQVARQAEKGVAKAERNAVQSQAEDIVNRVAKGESPIKEGGGFMRDSRLAQYQPEIIDTATKEMRQDLNELNKLSQGIRERAVKAEDVAKNIADNLPAQKVKARELALAGQRLAGSIMADARNLAAQMGKKRPQHFSGTSRELVSSLINRTREVAKMTDGAEIFNALDDLKRTVDNYKVALESGSRRSAKDPLAYQNLIPRVEEFANQVRSALEDVPTFGRAGEMQKAYNATYHQKWFPAKRVFEESVFKVTGRDYRAFDTLDAWESKITNLLKDSGTGERRHVADMLGALKEMAEQRAKYGTASAKETGRIVELVDKIERTFKLGDETMAASRRMQNLTNAAGVGAAAAGAVFGGVPGAVLSGGIARGAAELATGKYRRAFAAMRGATDDAVNNSVDDWISVSKARGSANDNGRRLSKKLIPQLSDEDRALLKSARRLGTTFGVAQFLGENDDQQSAFAQKKQALMDDAGFMNRFAEEFGDLAQEEPSVYMVAAGKAAETRKFLIDRLPANIAVSMARPNGYPPTNEAIEDWSVYWNAATNPRSAIASMARGDIRPQEVETLRTLHRPIYEALQSSLIDRISRATELGDDLDDQFVMRMSMLFDLDGACTPAFSNRAAAVARSVTPQNQQAQPQKPFAPKAATRVNPSNVAVTGPTYGTMPG